MASGKTVLLVAIEGESRALLEGCLELMGCDVLVAENALQAFRHLALEGNTLPDLVILGLPPFARTEVLERIRRDPEIGKVPVVIVGAASGGSPASAGPLLYNPGRLSALMARVRSYLEAEPSN
jgi:CheY-like chemotaxis protein